MKYRTILVPLFRDLRLASDDDVNYSYIDLDAQQLANLLAFAEQVDVYVATNGGNSWVVWNLELISGFDRNTEAAAFALAASDFGVTAGAAKVTYSTTANFMLNTRARLRYKRGPSQSGTKSILASAVLAVRTVGM